MSPKEDSSSLNLLALVSRRLSTWILMYLVDIIELVFPFTLNVSVSAFSYKQKYSEFFKYIVPEFNDKEFEQLER